MDTSIKPPRRAHTVAMTERDRGAMTAPPPATKMELTSREKAILRDLLGALQPDGAADPVSRRELAASANMMQQLYYSGLVMGAGSRDHRGTGNTPDSSWWWLTSAGERIARSLPPSKRRRP